MHTPAFTQRSELMRALWSLRREFLVVGLFSLVANLLMLVPTVYMLQVYDRVMSSGSELTLLAVSLLCLFLLGVMATAEWFRSRVLVRVGVQIDQALSTRVFNAGFDAYLVQTSASPARIFSDLVQLRQFLTGQGVYAFFDAPWVPVYILLLFLMHPVLGWTAIALACTQAFVGWFGHRHTLAPSEASMKAQAEAQSYLGSKLTHAEVVESMGMTDSLRRQWANRHREAMENNDVAQAHVHRMAAISRFLRYVQQSMGLGVGAVLVINGEITTGAMIASNVLIGRAIQPIDQVVSTWRAIAGVRQAFLRIERLLEQFPQRDAALSRTTPKGALALRGVVATADGRRDPILKKVDAHFNPGTVTAVLGPSGSGKSTLARVIVGIWPEVRGEVLLDGVPLDSWDRNELGPHIGYLPQDIELFDGTLAENIARFGEVDAQKVIAAAQCTGLHEMILRFPKGYDTPVGEAGQILSGGQRQRIALARAVYGDPALIVLDEPNANLDDAGEAALMQAVRELRGKGKTIVLITHRPGALAAADRVLVLRDGHVQSFGTREEVLAALRPPAPLQPTALATTRPSAA